MKEIQPSVNDARLQAILDESRTRAKQVSDSNKFCEAEWQKLGELSDALFLFSCWREVLERDLKRRPSQDECCERFGTLVSGLKTVVRQHGYEDFYQMIADSNATNPEHRDACGILHGILTAKPTECIKLIQSVYGKEIPVCIYLFHVLIPLLYRDWNRDFCNIQRLPQSVTLRDLRIVSDMRDEARALLLNKRPEIAEFANQLKHYCPVLEFKSDFVVRCIELIPQNEHTNPDQLQSLSITEFISALNENECNARAVSNNATTELLPGVGSQGNDSRVSKDSKPVARPEIGCIPMFNGKPSTAKGRILNIIMLFEERHSITFDDLKLYIDDVVQDSTVHTWINRVNNSLRDDNAPWRLSATGRIVKKNLLKNLNQSHE